MFYVLCIESDEIIPTSDYTYNVMCMADSLIFVGSEKTPALRTREDVQWWVAFERCYQAIVDAACEQGTSIDTVEDELGIVWDDYGASINKIADYFGVPGID